VDSKRFNPNIPLIATFIFGLIVYVCWMQVFKGFYTSSNNLFELCQEQGIINGTVHWLHWLDTTELLLLFCFLTPLPMVIAKKGRFTPIPFFIVMVFLFYGMWRIDYWNNGNTLTTWYDWNCLPRYSMLGLPLFLTWAGSYIISDIYNLIQSFKKIRFKEYSLPKSYVFPCSLILLGLLNLGCIFIGFSTSIWFKDYQQGPFADGFWHGSPEFFPPPSYLYSLFSCYAGIVFVTLFGIVLFIASLALPYFTKEWIDARRGMFISFICSGFFGLWIFADVFFNYDIIYMEDVWEIYILECLVALYSLMFLSMATSVYINKRNVEPKNSGDCVPQPQI
jgi:hypothetical protein